MFEREQAIGAAAVRRLLASERTTLRLRVQNPTADRCLGSKAFPLQLEQSQLGGAVLSPKQLHGLAADYISQLSEEGLLGRRTFELMDGSASLEEIAHKLAAEFPKRFSSRQEAMMYAGVVSQEYSR